MRLLFDGFWWDKGPGANRTVQRELVLAWARCFPMDELVLAVRGSAGEERPADIPPSCEVVRTRLWPHALSNLVELPLLARRTKADVVVVHNYTPVGVPTVTFIHDAMFVEHPDWFSRSERAYFAPMLPLARRARLVATSSRTEAGRVSRLGGAGVPQPVDIGLAVPATLADARPRRPASVPEQTSFALTVGRLNVRKNLERLMAAVRHSSVLGPDRPLMVVGGTAHSGVSTELSGDIAQLVDSGAVRLLGPVPDEELAWLYAQAGLVVTLSLDEGFGMPAVEAAHFGAPLLASDIPVFRETVAGYASFVAPLARLEEVAAAMDRAWEQRPDPAVRAAIMGRYTWEDAVRRLRSEMLAAHLG